MENKRTNYKKQAEELEVARAEAVRVNERHKDILMREDQNLGENDSTAIDVLP